MSIFVIFFVKFGHFFQRIVTFLPNKIMRSEVMNISTPAVM